MVINDVKEGKFYGLLPQKENTGMAIIVFMILVTSTWLIQKLYNNNYCFLLLFVFLVAKGSQDD